MQSRPFGRTIPAVTSKTTARSDDRRNFLLGLYNGILNAGADAFFHSSLVLAPFLAKLGAPGWAIGMIPALRIGGWFLPQLFVASRMAHQPFKLPLYRRSSIVRASSFVVLAIVATTTDVPAGTLIALTLTALMVSSVAAGIGGVPFAEVTSKVVPHYRLGTFWVLRNVIGGLLALVAGWVLAQVLGSAIPFPRNFGLVFTLGSILVAGSFLAFAAVREPADPPRMKEPLRTMLGRIPGMLRDNAPYRRYLRVRALAMAALLAEPFYAVHATFDLGAPPAALGGYVVVATAAAILGNVALRKAADHGRNVTVLQIGVAGLCLAPLLAVVITDWRLFALVFAVAASSIAAVDIASWNLLFAVGAGNDRSLYFGATNTVLTVPSLMPILAGAAIGTTGYLPVFVAAAVMAAAAFASSFRFVQLRDLDRAASAKGLADVRAVDR